MQWWCAATGAEWTWAWQPYPGIWLAMGLLGTAWWRRVGARPAIARSAVHCVRFSSGLLLLWVALDWPVGALGAGYLVSAHSAQYVLITFAAVPLLLTGVPPAAWPGSEHSVAGRLLRRLAQPVVGLMGYIAVLGITHLPAVTDFLMRSQAGSFAIDLLWVLGALLLWWPVLAPEGQQRMAPPLRIGYLFVATIPPTVPAAFMVFAKFPLYAVYELAPRVAGIPAMTDQQTAGVVMKAAADPMLWLAMAIIFFRWYAAEEREERMAKEAIS